MNSKPKNTFRDILSASNYEETKNYRGSNQSEKDFPNTINPLVTKLPHDPKYQKDIQNREMNLLSDDGTSGAHLTGLILPHSDFATFRLYRVEKMEVPLDVSLS